MEHAKSALVRDLAFTPDGKHLASCDSVGTLTLREADTGKVVWSKIGQLVCLAMSSDGATLASGSADGRIVLWDLPSGKQRSTWRGGAGITNVAFQSAGRLLATSHAENVVSVWDPSTKALVHQFAGHSNLITEQPTPVAANVQAGV
jgi:WD40 repeat protein